MTTVTTIKNFVDKEAVQNRFIGQSFDCSPERAKYLADRGFVTYEGYTPQEVQIVNPAETKPKRKRG